MADYRFSVTLCLLGVVSGFRVVVAVLWALLALPRDSLLGYRCPRALLLLISLIALIVMIS
jgi:hypothetical protein